jgi:hypothetical protein
MIAEILKILENLVVFIPILTIMAMLIFMIKDIMRNKYTLVRIIKGFLCIGISLFILLMSLVYSTMDMARTGQMWKEYENGYGNPLNATIVEPCVKELSYLSGLSFILFVSSISIMAFWYFIYFRQVIPGKGSVIERIKELGRDLKVK